ncbi:MAG: hypothetical protein ACFFEY_02395 [Candidatus Thorarchaeota archaeon]
MNNIKTGHKFKIFKYDAAPFFFYIEIFPPDITFFKKEYHKRLLESIKTNPIMPIPMRIDRVFNGEKSILIRPREPMKFSFMDDSIAIINPTPFLQYGFEKLLYFTEVRAYENFSVSLALEKVNNWWNSTKFLYAKLLRLEEDFSAFLRIYIQTLLKTKQNEGDLIGAAKEYSTKVKEICEKRIKENDIPVETKGQETNVKIYKEKIAKYRKKMKKVEEIQYHPELVDIDIFDFSESGFNDNVNYKNLNLEELKPKEIKYIPLLFYDDLLECMLQNLKKLDDGEDNILDPVFLLDKNVIIIAKSKEINNHQYQKYSWIHSFENIRFSPIIDSMKNIKLEYYKSIQSEYAKRK